MIPRRHRPAPPLSSARSTLSRSGRCFPSSGSRTTVTSGRLWEDPAVKAFLPWLAVLAVVLLLSALRQRALATVVSLGWLAWCVWTWFRPTRRNSRPG
ncbi:hypothetical protein ADK66_19405 [Micromonospora sp. NRRL B-16802]|nr:hypothetical protein ADK66_19405 [Micromonospora sp. NRRL B-16802]